jgi:hypothetical protein
MPVLGAHPATGQTRLAPPQRLAVAAKVVPMPEAAELLYAV